MLPGISVSLAHPAEEPVRRPHNVRSGGMNAREARGGIAVAAVAAALIAAWIALMVIVASATAPVRALPGAQHARQWADPHPIISDEARP
jgi:hypothetical protein